MTAWVDREGVEMLFGCSSFHGTEAPGVLRCLRASARPPYRTQALAAAGQGAGCFPLRRPSQAQARPQAGAGKDAAAVAHIPADGGWVSDHAVIDRDLGTLHVFTGLEIRAVPPARARLLRAVAG